MTHRGQRGGQLSWYGHHHTQSGNRQCRQSKTVQTLDSYGNIVTSQIYDYGNTSTPSWTYNWTYLHQIDGNYTPRYIRNRVKTATVTAGGITTTLVTNS